MLAEITRSHRSFASVSPTALTSPGPDEAATGEEEKKRSKRARETRYTTCVKMNEKRTQCLRCVSQILGELCEDLLLAEE